MGLSWAVAENLAADAPTRSDIACCRNLAAHSRLHLNILLGRRSPVLLGHHGQSEVQVMAIQASAHANFDQMGQLDLCKKCCKNQVFRPKWASNTPLGCMSAVPQPVDTGTYKMSYRSQVARPKLASNILADCKLTVLLTEKDHLAQADILKGLASW